MSNTRSLGRVDKDLLKTAFEQNWEHARYVLMERMGFTSIYAAIMAGVLAFISQSGKSIATYIPLIVLLIMFSIMGLIVTIKLNLEFHQHITYAIEIAKVLKLENYMGIPLGMYGRIRGKKLLPSLFSVSAMFLLFYLLSLFTLIALIAHVFINLSISIALIIFLLFAFLLFLIIYEWQRRKYDAIDEEVKRQIVLA